MFSLLCLLRKGHFSSREVEGRPKWEVGCAEHCRRALQTSQRSPGRTYGCAQPPSHHWGKRHGREASSCPAPQVEKQEVSIWETHWSLVFLSTVSNSRSERGKPSSPVVAADVHLGPSFSGYRFACSFILTKLGTGFHLPFRVKVVLGCCKPIWLVKEYTVLNREERTFPTFTACQSAEPGRQSSLEIIWVGLVSEEAKRPQNLPSVWKNNFQIVRQSGLLATQAACAWQSFHLPGQYPEVSKAGGKSFGS